MVRQGVLFGGGMTVITDFGNLGQAVRHLRQLRGLSMEALGNAAGLQPTTVGTIERGRVTSPAWRSVNALAKALDLRVSSLVAQAETIGANFDTGRSPALVLYNVGPTVRRLRQRKRLKSEELARRAGISSGQLCNIEGQRCDLRWKTFCRLAGGFDITISDLARETEVVPQMEAMPTVGGLLATSSYPGDLDGPSLDEQRGGAVE